MTPRSHRFPLHLSRIAAGLALMASTVACAPPDGAALFAGNCAVCHRFQGAGGGMGPDLTAVANRLSAEQIIATLNDPRAGRPQARMPSFDHFSSAQKQALASFLAR